MIVGGTGQILPVTGGAEWYVSVLHRSGVGNYRRYRFVGLFFAGLGWEVR